MTTDAAIGQNIQHARYRARMSQADLAKLLSLHRTAVSRMEAGVRAVTALELVRIADALGVPVSDLLAPHTRARAHPRMSRLLLRAAYVTDDDHHQLGWASRLWEIASERLSSGKHIGPVRRPRFLSPVQTAELYADMAREVIGLRATDPVQGLSAIAMDLGVIVVVARMPSKSQLSGCSIMGEGHASLALVNANHPEPRQRFTLAHEIGHHILHRNNGAITCQEASARRGRPPASEFEADVFASAFLLPRRALRALARSWPHVPSLIQAVEARYVTSRSATVARLRGLDLIGESDARALRRLAGNAQEVGEQPDYRRVGTTLARLASEFDSEKLVEGTATRIVPDAEVVR